VTVHMPMGAEPPARAGASPEAVDAPSPRGGGRASPEGGGPEVELAGPIPAAARAPAAGLLRVEDESATWTLSVPDAFTTRTLTLESPTGSGQPTLQRGDRVVLRWSPATDVHSKP
jgi:hypothetical protein